jgi:ankyrin repeat protein
MDPAKFLKESDIFRFCLDVLSCKGNLQNTIVRLQTKYKKYKHPLLQYCAIGWARHGIASGDSDSMLVQKVVSLFEDHQRAMLIANVLCTEGIYQSYSYFNNTVSPLHIHACLGLRQLVMHLLPRPGLKVTEWFMHMLPRWFWKRSLINSRDSSRYTAVSVAIQAGHTDIALYLINHPKININVHSAGPGRCPLSYAAEMGNAVVARALLRRGAKPDRCDLLMRTPLSYAVSKDAIEVVKLLLCIPGNNPDIPDQDFRTPLSHAASANAIGTAKLILNLGNVDVDSKDLLGRTPLWYAADAGALDFVKLLLDTGKVNLHMLDYSGKTALSYAAEMGRTAVAKALLEFGADVNARDGEGDTLLSKAVRAENTAMVKVLLEFGADVDTLDREGHIPLFKPVRAETTAMMKVLLELGADVDARDREGRTPLSNAARVGNIAMVKVLLEFGADVDARDREGHTPLSNVVRAGNTAMVKVLLEFGADVDVRDREGHTPSSNAVRAGRIAMVGLLLEFGADADARDEEGRTPLSFAAGLRRGEGGSDIVKLLLKSGQRLDCDSRCKLRRTSLWYAVSIGSISRVKLLLATGKVCIDSQDVDGRTPLAVAARQLDDRMVRLLLERNANVNVKDNEGKTPLYLAENYPFWSSRRITEEDLHHRHTQNSSISLLSEREDPPNRLSRHPSSCPSWLTVDSLPRYT